jgi:hypothetical protein
MQLDSFPVLEVQVGKGEIHFLLKCLYIAVCMIPVTRDDRGTGAEPAQGLTERQVKIEGKRGC